SAFAAGGTPGAVLPCRASSRASNSSSLIRSLSFPAATAATALTGVGAGAVPISNWAIRFAGAGAGSVPAATASSMACSQSSDCWAASKWWASNSALPERASPRVSSATWHSSTIGVIDRKPAPPLSVWKPRNTRLSCSASCGACSSVTSCSPRRSRISWASRMKSAAMSSAKALMRLQPQIGKQVVGVVLGNGVTVQSAHGRAGQCVAGCFFFRLRQAQRTEALVYATDDADHAADDLAGEVLVALGQGDLGEVAADLLQRLFVFDRRQAVFAQAGDQFAALFGQVQRAMGGLLGHLHDVVQARAGIIQLAGIAGHGGQVTQRLAQLACQPAQSGHHRLRAQSGQRVDFPAPAGLVATFQRAQRLLQMLDQRVAVACCIGGRDHQVLAARRSKILPSFSSR